MPSSWTLNPLSGPDWDDHFVHSVECSRIWNENARLRREWSERWPDYCKKCEGHGGIEYEYDPSPSGISLSPGSMMDFEPCTECTENGLCPRCTCDVVDHMPREEQWRYVAEFERATGLTADKVDVFNEWLDARGPCPNCGWTHGDIADDHMPPEYDGYDICMKWCHSTMSKEINNYHLVALGL